MAKAAKETDSGRTPAEDRFLAECFLAFDAAVGKVDMAAVAQAMGYSNQGSAANKYNELRKRLNFAAKAFNTSPQKSKRPRTDSPDTPTKTAPKQAGRKRAASKAFENMIKEEAEDDEEEEA